MSTDKSRDLSCNFLRLLLAATLRISLRTRQAKAQLPTHEPCQPLEKWNTGLFSLTISGPRSDEPERAMHQVGTETWPGVPLWHQRNACRHSSRAPAFSVAQLVPLERPPNLRAAPGKRRSAPHASSGDAPATTGVPGAWLPVAGNHRFLIEMLVLARLRLL